MARLGSAGEDDVHVWLPLDGSGAPNLGQALAGVELEGGGLAFRTELIDVRVAPGAELWLMVERVSGADEGGSVEQSLVVWGEPALSGEQGERSLLDLDVRAFAVSERAPALKHQSPDDRELLLGGRPIDNALLAPIPSAVRFRVPAGYDRLVVECGFDGARLPAEPDLRVRCRIFSGETPRCSSDAGARKADSEKQ